MKNWADIASTSHYQTAVEVREELYAGNMQEAIRGVTELIDALYRSDKRALRAQLVRLMKHILKWHCGREYRTTACRVSINDARQEIACLLEDTPALTHEYIDLIWQRVFEYAHNEAAIEIGIESEKERLSWREVFEQEYPQDTEFAELRLSVAHT